MRLDRLDAEQARTVALRAASWAAAPGAKTWAASTLSNYLHRQDGIDVPDGLVARSGLSDVRDLVGRWSRFAMALTAEVGRRGLSPARAVRVAVPDAVRMLEKRHSPRRVAREAVLHARRSPMRWSWLPGESERNVSAVIAAGSLRFNVEFRGYGCGQWHRGWGISPETEAILHYGCRNTGLFAGIDAALREMTREFVERLDPERLEIHGADPKRNEHNARAYAVGVPDDYEFRAIKDPDQRRAAPDGTVGIELVRRPEAPPPRPFDRARLTESRCEKPECQASFPQP